MLDHAIPLSATFPAQLLDQVIRQRVVPALIDLHGAAGPLPEAMDLAQELARGGLGESRIQRLVAVGLPFEALMLRVIAPAARQLGEMWQTDDCSFAAVTLGLWRLRNLAARVGDLLPGLAVAPDPQRSILLATLPGEQHDFGIVIVAEFLARGGWLVTRSVPRDARELLGELRALRPAVVGFSVSRDSAEQMLTALIGQVRRLHPAPRVLVGGPVLAIDPMLAWRCGADAAATCARSALEAAQSLLGAPDGARASHPQRKDRCVGNAETGGRVSGVGPERDGTPRLGRG